MNKGPNNKGPNNKAVVVSSWDDFKRIYGGAYVGPGYFTPEQVASWGANWDWGLDPLPPAETKYECGGCKRQVTCEGLPSGWTTRHVTHSPGRTAITPYCSSCS